MAIRRRSRPPASRICAARPWRPGLVSRSDRISLSFGTSQIRIQNGRCQYPDPHPDYHSLTGIAQACSDGRAKKGAAHEKRESWVGFCETNDLCSQLRASDKRLVAVDELAHDERRGTELKLDRVIGELPDRPGGRRVGPCFARMRKGNLLGYA